ncbi:DUF6345 domain-containing protein [Leifsonia sp. YIM 134122]|uniref:DUF6345 domain-containing protein n=1 Tax=Leifsonia stereocauli TaxID=3134136 RepID=A0ABU9W259_9MICO
MSDNLYAGSSNQTFAEPTVKTLKHTHDDTSGFLDYVGRFAGVNFHAQDGNVKQWRFDADFDDWQDALGMDSVRVYYHSSHGAMDAAGVFNSPMGAVWSGRNRATSDRMRLADQDLRYLFLSTCNSVRIDGGDDPFRTWSTANVGMRMIFGYGSISYDWGGYGGGFFDRWNSGSSFSQAWQDNSLGHRTDQVVSSVACGATAAEAQNRLWNERLFSGSRVADDWYWWRWAGSPAAKSESKLSPDELPARLHLSLARRSGDLDRVSDLAGRFGVEAVAATVGDPGRSSRLVFLQRRESPRLVLLADGSVSITVAPLDRAAEVAPEDVLRAAADEAARQFDPDGVHDLVFDQFTSTRHAGVSRSGDVVEAEVSDVTAHYRQRIDGTPVASGGDGHVAITLDRSGRLHRILDRTVDVRERWEAEPASDQGEGEMNAREALDRAQRQLHDPCDRGVVEFDPETDEVGYRLSGEEGYLVAVRSVTVTDGEFSKRHLVEVPLS